MCNVFGYLFANFGKTIIKLVDSMVELGDDSMDSTQMSVDYLESMINVNKDEITLKPSMGQNAKSNHRHQAYSVDNQEVANINIELIMIY